MACNLAVAVTIAVAVAEAVPHKGSGRAVAGSVARRVLVAGVRTVVTVGWRRDVVAVGGCTVRWLAVGWLAVGRLGVPIILQRVILCQNTLKLKKVLAATVN